jgi:uncharacterized RDD family membrane protein YckC
MPPLAGWWQRVGAQLLDALILIAFAIVPVIIVAVIVAGGSGDSDSAGAAAEAVYFVIVLAFYLIYYPLTMKRPGAHNGQSWGKQALGIRVVRIDGQPFQASNAIVRELLVKAILMGICFIVQILNYLWPLWDEKNQALHDKVVNTMVVQA